MAINFQVVIPNKLYRSGRIMPGDIEYLTSNILKVKTIISLDQAAGDLIAKYIPDGIKHIMYPIQIGGNPTVQARGLSTLIKSGVFDSKDGATIVHCERGVDRTGLAIALYRSIKQHWNCEDIFREANNKQYGSGLSPNVKKAFDMEICRYCPGDYCKKFIVDDKKLETGPDAQQINDGIIEADSTPPAFNPQQSFAPFMDSNNTYPGSIRIASVKRKLRKRFLKKLLKKKDEQNALDTGLINNTNIIPASSYNPTSGTIDVPNAGGLSGMSTLPNL